MHNKLLETEPQNIPLSQGLYEQGNLHQQAKSQAKIIQDSSLDACDDHIITQNFVENDLLCL